MSSVSFIADPHFGHRNICKYRTQFKTPEEHDEYLIECWNKVAHNKRDVVWVLGDFCIHNEKYNMPKLIDRLNGQIFLITGNHCHLPYYNHPKIKLFPALVSRYGFWLSHAPIHPLELRGKKNIHGHVHYQSVPDDNYINVCAEVINFTPINLETLR